jgi:alpha/beta superfamily hydrolase
MIINGENDPFCPLANVNKLVEKLNSQRGISIDYRVIPDCDHSFKNHLDVLRSCIMEYIGSESEKPGKIAASI